MPVRLKLHVDDSPVLKSEASWISHVVDSVGKAVSAYQNGPATQSFEERVFLDVFLTNSREWDSVPFGISVGRLPPRSQPINATIHYRVADFQNNTDTEIAEVVEADCDAALIEVRTMQRSDKPA